MFRHTVQQLHILVCITSKQTNKKGGMANLKVAISEKWKKKNEIMGKSQ